MMEIPGRDPKKSRNLIAVFGDMGNERWVMSNGGREWLGFGVLCGFGLGAVRLRATGTLPLPVGEVWGNLCNNAIEAYFESDIGVCSP